MFLLVSIILFNTTPPHVKVLIQGPLPVLAKVGRILPDEIKNESKKCQKSYMLLYDKKNSLANELTDKT
jgi:hypothetical protein